MTKKTHQLVLLLISSMVVVSGCSSDQATESVETPKESVTEPIPTIVDGNMNPCDDEKSALVVTATVTNVPLEGGFWGLQGEDSQKYLPMNLDGAFRKEGAVISFTYDEVTDMQSIQQWGTMIRIKEVCSADIPSQVPQAESSET